MKYCGIYRINNVVTGDSYIGGSNDIGARLAAHLGALAGGRHPNKRLQANYNDHGGAAFTTEHLESVWYIGECPGWTLDRESHFIATFSPTLNMPLGGHELDHETALFRIDTVSADLLRRLAGISGKSIGAFGHDELVPMLRELLAKKLKAASQELAKEAKEG